MKVLIGMVIIVLLTSCQASDKPTDKPTIYVWDENDTACDYAVMYRKEKEDEKNWNHPNSADPSM